jgi:hypothetical protein
MTLMPHRVAKSFDVLGVHLLGLVTVYSFRPVSRAFSAEGNHEFYLIDCRIYLIDRTY